MTKMKVNYKKLIVDDFKDAIRLMEASKNPDEILYYFSATNAVLQRVFNFQFNARLVFVHSVLLAVYAGIKARIDAIKGGENTILLTKEFFEQLIALTKELLSRIEKDEEPFDVLEKLNLLGFSITGNGFYLLRKGFYKL
jgi:hypothetical protein